MMNSKPKILIVGPAYPYRNGPSVYLYHLCKQLSPDFEMLVVNYSMLYPNFLFPGKTQYDESKDALAFPNVRLVNSLNPLSWVKTARYINKQQPDMIVFDWWHPFFAPCHTGIVSFLKKSLKRKVVYLTENVISHEANKTDKALTRLALKNANCFLALSDAVKKHLESMFDKRVFRSELPIYDFYRLSKPEENIRTSFGFSDTDNVFLFFGLVRRYKGLDLLLEAFGELAKQDASVKLLVVGEFYEDIKPYTDIIEKYGINDKVIVENRYISNDEVERYMMACDAVVLPYRSATQSGILNVAYGFYKPVIVTNVGELGSLVDEGETGHIVAKPDVADIKEGMQRYLQSKKNGTDYAGHIKHYITHKHSFKDVNGVFKNMLEYLRTKV